MKYTILHVYLFNISKINLSKDLKKAKNKAYIYERQFVQYSVIVKKNTDRIIL